MYLRTERLRLVAATPQLSSIEHDGAALAQALAAQVPASWPPREMTAALGAWTDALQREPALVGWVNWYWLHTAPHPPDELVGYGGFKGLPMADGTVEIGYAVLAGHQRHGYALEALCALLQWAWRDARVRRIDAETRPALEPSIALLERLGFRRLPQTDPEWLRFALDRPQTAAGSSAAQPGIGSGSSG